MITFVRTASIAPGKAAEAIRFAHGVVEFMRTKHGAQIEATRPIAGNPNRIAWFSKHASLAEFEESTRKLAGDPDYSSMIAAAAGIFLPGSIHDELWRGL